MKIETVTVKNYRNINEICVSFNPESNFIIGENNLGKSNFLSLLATICNGKGFAEQDFLNPERPIEVELTLNLCQNEQVFLVTTSLPKMRLRLK